MPPMMLRRLAAAMSAVAFTQACVPLSETRTTRTVVLERNERVATEEAEQRQVIEVARVTDRGVDIRVLDVSECPRYQTERYETHTRVERRTNGFLHGASYAVAGLSAAGGIAVFVDAPNVADGTSGVTNPIGSEGAYAIGIGLSVTALAALVYGIANSVADVDSEEVSEPSVRDTGEVGREECGREPRVGERVTIGGSDPVLVGSTGQGGMLSVDLFAVLGAIRIGRNDTVVLTSGSADLEVSTSPYQEAAAERAWRVVDTRSIGSLETYTRAFPNGPDADEARAQLHRLRALRDAPPIAPHGVAPSRDGHVWEASGGRRARIYETRPAAALWEADNGCVGEAELWVETERERHRLASWENCLFEVEGHMRPTARGTVIVEFGCSGEGGEDFGTCRAIEMTWPTASSVPTVLRRAGGHPRWANQAGPPGAIDDAQEDLRVALQDEDLDVASQALARLRGLHARGLEAAQASVSRLREQVAARRRAAERAREREQARRERERRNAIRSHGYHGMRLGMRTAAIRRACRRAGGRVTCDDRNCCAGSSVRALWTARQGRVCGLVSGVASNDPEDVRRYVEETQSRFGESAPQQVRSHYEYEWNVDEDLGALLVVADAYAFAAPHLRHLVANRYTATVSVWSHRSCSPGSD